MTQTQVSAGSIIICTELLSRGLVLELEGSLSSSSMQMQAHLQLLMSLIRICQDGVWSMSLAIQAEGVSLPQSVAFPESLTCTGNGSFIEGSWRAGEKRLCFPRV